MSFIAEKNILSPITRAVANADAGISGDPIRNDKILEALRNAADFAIKTRNSASITWATIQNALDTAISDQYATITIVIMRGAADKAKETCLHAQAAVDFAREQVRKRFEFHGKNAPPHYHHDKCKCDYCEPIKLFEEHA